MKPDFSYFSRFSEHQFDWMMKGRVYMILYRDSWELMRRHIIKGILII